MKKTVFFRTAFVLIAGLALLFSFAACNTPDKEVDAFTITDSMGREVGFKATPARIVSVSPEMTEILFELKLGAEIVGTSTWCDWPEAAKTTEKIGDFSNPNIELITALNPDVVFIAGGIQADNIISKLGEAGIPVVCVYAETVEDVLTNIELVGRITGREEDAAALVAKMRGEIEAVRAKAQGQTSPTVFYDIGGSWAPFKNSFITDVIKLAGGTSISADVEGYYGEYSTELLFAADPQFYLFDSYCFEYETPLATRDGYDGLSAVKNERVYIVEGDWINRGGPRVVLALKRLSELFFPED
ncbi:MAG: helical backbone metal receptor [Clostridiales bacterium]|nr:helical backbone metal receptor [Clostridiales bacterium]